MAFKCDYRTEERGDSVLQGTPQADAQQQLNFKRAIVKKQEPTKDRPDTIRRHTPPPLLPSFPAGSEKGSGTPP